MKIVNVEEMRRIEQAADSGGRSFAAMMEMAGGAVANISHALMAPEVDQPILLLIGPGNNGGDGLVAARELMQLGHPVAIYVWKRDTKGDQLFRQLKRKRRGITILYADNDPGFEKLREELRNTDLVIDALLGTGAVRPIEGTLAELLAIAREELNRDASYRSRKAMVLRSVCRAFRSWRRWRWVPISDGTRQLDPPAGRSLSRRIRRGLPRRR